jgi:hypothetical protein
MTMEKISNYLLINSMMELKQEILYLKILK